MNATGKYLKVWKVEEKSGYTFLDLGDSRKNRGGEYENCTWFGCILLGDAAGKSFKEGDVVEITSSQIFMEKYNDKWNPKVKIFHIKHMEVEENQNNEFQADNNHSAPPVNHKFPPPPPPPGSGKGAGIDDKDIPF